MTLSVIVPIYNNFDKLKGLLKSLSQQTVFSLCDVEIILVNDGSEQTVSIPFVKELEDKVRYHIIEHGGAPKARNFGYNKSTGEYIFFCDADVIFCKKDALEQMINKLKENVDKSYCYSSFRYGWKKINSGKFNEDILKERNEISTMSMVRKSALEKIKDNGPWDESLKRFQDWDLWLTMLENDLHGIGISKVLWRVKTDGKMSSWFPARLFKYFKENKVVKGYLDAKDIVLKKHWLI
ncbi:MAG: glycosyltransferase family A protein [Patescibacteria group bacterium]